MLLAVREPKAGNDPKGARSVLLTVGLSLVVYGIFRWFYQLVPAPSCADRYYYLILVISLALPMLADINHAFMQRSYGNQFMEAYLSYKVAQVLVDDADHCYLSEIPQTAAPYHLIQYKYACHRLKESKIQRAWGASFIVSLLNSGTESI
jgi:hypothetical protein